MVLKGEVVFIYNTRQDILNLIKSGRRVGNTTRLVNLYVEKIYENYIVKIYDHCDKDVANSHCFEQVVKRLSSDSKLELFNTLNV